MTSLTRRVAATRIEKRQLWALRLVPPLAALGPTFFFFEIAGAGLFPFRIAVAALLLLTLGSISYWRRRPLARLFLEVVLLWTVWSGVSLLWAPDTNKGIDETIALAFGLVVSVVMFNLGIHRESYLDALAEGWTLAYVVTGAFAVRELVTGQYLPGDTAEYFLETGSEGIAISTFGNPNNYAAFLLLCVPFLLLAYLRASTKRRRRLMILLIASTPVLMFFTTSRIGLVALAAQFVAFAAVGLRTHSQRIRYLTLGAVVVVFIGSVFWSNSETAASIEATFEQSLTEEVRFNLTGNGMWMLWRSGGFGVGAAGYAVVTDTEQVPYDTGGLVDPHNFWIEILAQYGFIIFLAVLLWFVRMARLALRMRRWSRREYSHYSFYVSATILIGLVGYAFAAFASSSFIAQSHNWAFLASLAALAASLEHSRWEVDTTYRRRDLAAARPEAGAAGG